VSALTVHDVLELDAALHHPAGDLEAEMREWERALELQAPDAPLTWLSAIGVCCF
jgi:hypothetical protein